MREKRSYAHGCARRPAKRALTSFGHYKGGRAFVSGRGAVVGGAFQTRSAVEPYGSRRLRTFGAPDGIGRLGGGLLPKSASEPGPEWSPIQARRLGEAEFGGGCARARTARAVGADS